MIQARISQFTMPHSIGNNKNYEDQETVDR